MLGVGPFVFVETDLTKREGSLISGMKT